MGSSGEWNIKCKRENWDMRVDREYVGIIYG